MPCDGRDEIRQDWGGDAGIEGGRIGGVSCRNAPFSVESASMCERVGRARSGRARLLVGSLLAVAAVGAAGAARADDDVATVEAKAHYQRATAHFAVGEYREAAAEYEAAFKIKQDPALLYDAAQAHRLAGENQKALLLYKNIIKLYPESNQAQDAQERIGKLEQAMASGPPGSSAASPPSTAPSPTDNGPSVVSPPLTEPGGAAGPVVPAATAPAPLSAPPQSHATVPALTSSSGASFLGAEAMPGPPPRRPIYKRWWFWTGLVVVAGGVAATVLATRSSASWSNLSDAHGVP
jgi:hypothetical protein